jgi:hypothetical protein
MKNNCGDHQRRFLVPGMRWPPRRPLALWRLVAHMLVLVGAALALGAPAAAIAYDECKADFSVRLNDRVCPYSCMGVFLLPEETLKLEVIDENDLHAYSVQSAAGTLAQIGPRKWRWRAPEAPAVHPVIIRRISPPDTVTLNVFVTVPYKRLRGEYLGDYRIGNYPSVPLKGLSIYERPKGFVEVTEENANTPVSPHFKLKQFLCKQDGSYPKYLILKEALLLKLELILQAVNERGYTCDTFHIMSGYRTPYYNKAIGNVKYSRHLWGGAADIFIDENPRDGMMDDLNRDSKIDYRDAAVLYDIIDGLYGKPFYASFVGGLARYRKTPTHGPFVHVDVRGFRARWGESRTAKPKAPEPLAQTAPSQGSEPALGGSAEAR